MEATAAVGPRVGIPRPRLDPEAAGPWLLGFAPVLYLALQGGGYDLIARSELGVLAWWIVLLGVLAGVLPRARFGVSAWIAVGLLGCFLAWTWIAAGWTPSVERTLAEAARVATYLGALVLGLACCRTGNARWLVLGLACSIGLVSFLADLSRLIPSWFPKPADRNFYAESRLSYPFDYSDGVGEFASLGLPLLLYAAGEARTLAGRALAAAALPTVVLCLALTLSRGGLLAAAIGLAFFFALVPNRLPKLAIGLVAAATSAFVLAELLSNPAVHNGFEAAGAPGQRRTVLLALLAACVVTGLAQAGIALAGRRVARPRWLTVSRRGAAITAAGLALAFTAGVVVIFASGASHHLWTDFKRPAPPAVHGNAYFRLFSLSGSRRYQYWHVALDAYRSHRLKGIGPGTFDLYWAQHQTLGEFIRNAHSLYIETLAELGLIGFVLILGFVLAVLAGGVVRTFRVAASERAVVAAASAGFAGFAAAAFFDWIWQIGVIPIAGMLLAGAALAGSAAPRRRISPERAAILLGTIVALVAIARPLGVAVQVRSSQKAVQAGNLTAALADARSAQSFEPSGASPRLQRALVLEQSGDIAGARGAIAEAQAREPTNWQIWLVSSRLATEADRPAEALADYRRARSLNPKSPLFP